MLGIIPICWSGGLKRAVQRSVAYYVWSIMNNGQEYQVLRLRGGINTDDEDPFEEEDETWSYLYPNVSEEYTDAWHYFDVDDYRLMKVLFTGKFFGVQAKRYRIVRIQSPQITHEFPHTWRWSKRGTYLYTRYTKKMIYEAILFTTCMCSSRNQCRKRTRSYRFQNNPFAVEQATNGGPLSEKLNYLKKVRRYITKYLWIPDVTNYHMSYVGGLTVYQWNDFPQNPILVIYAMNFSLEQEYANWLFRREIPRQLYIPTRIDYINLFVTNWFFRTRNPWHIFCEMHRQMYYDMAIGPLTIAAHHRKLLFNLCEEAFVEWIDKEELRHRTLKEHCELIINQACPEIAYVLPKLLKESVKENIFTRRHKLTSLINFMHSANFSKREDLDMLDMHCSLDISEIPKEYHRISYLHICRILSSLYHTFISAIQVDYYQHHPYRYHIGANKLRRLCYRYLKSKRSDIVPSLYLFVMNKYLYNWYVLRANWNQDIILDTYDGGDDGLDEFEVDIDFGDEIPDLDDIEVHDIDGNIIEGDPIVYFENHGMNAPVEQLQSEKEVKLERLDNFIMDLDKEAQEQLKSDLIQTYNQIIPPQQQLTTMSTLNIMLKFSEYDKFPLLCEFKNVLEDYKLIHDEESGPFGENISELINNMAYNPMTNQVINDYEIENLIRDLRYYIRSTKKYNQNNNNNGRKIEELLLSMPKLIEAFYYGIGLNHSNHITPPSEDLVKYLIELSKQFLRIEYRPFSINFQEELIVYNDSLKILRAEIHKYFLQHDIYGYDVLFLLFSFLRTINVNPILCRVEDYDVALYGQLLVKLKEENDNEILNLLRDCQM